MIDLSRKARILAWLAATPFLIVVFMFELVPLIAVAGNSLQTETAVSLANYIEILTSKFYMGSFKVSFAISIATALIGLAVGLPAAVILRRMPGRVQQFVVICSNIGANFTGFPLAFSFVIMLGVSGSFTLLLQRVGLLTDFNIYSTSGLVIAYSYFQILFAILLVLPSLAAITAEIEEAAYLVGATRLALWRRIGLPI